MNRNEVLENNRLREERFKLYKSFGYDYDLSRGFIAEKMLPISGKVLEVGTGKGYSTVVLAKNAEFVISVDVSEKERKIAQLNAAQEGLLHKVHFLSCDGEKLFYKDKSFDVVVSINSFHHFEKPFEVLSEMIRVCKTKLVVADFNKKGFEIIRKIHASEGHHHEEESGNFSIVGQYLKEHGFRVEKYDDCCQVVYVAERIK